MHAHLSVQQILDQFQLVQVQFARPNGGNRLEKSARNETEFARREGALQIVKERREIFDHKCLATDQQILRMKNSEQNTLIKW